MYSNITHTPQMAELGAAIVAAVTLVINNPKEAEAVASAHIEAHKLTGDQVEQYDEAVELIKQAAELRRELQESLDGIDAREKKLAEDQLALKQRQAEHSANVSDLNRAVAGHDARDAQIEVREQKLDEGEEELARNWDLLRRSEEAVKKREAAVREREAATQEFANKIRGAGAA